MKYDIRDLMLLNMAGIGFLRFEKLKECYSSLKSVIRAGKERLQAIEGMGPNLAERICRIDEKSLIREEGLMKKHGVRVISFFDAAYPENLKNIYNPPLILYVKGSLLAQDKLSIALVGSRKASIYGMDISTRLSSSLVSMGFTIISGLARGIDSAAHRGALLEHGRTIAVLGSGIGQIYPIENRKLSGEIAESGALVSEFSMGMPPLRHHFPMRNRIISGLSLGTVIVEAARKSGALITASYALEQGREVFAVPGKALSSTSSGTHQLIKDGAKLVDNVGDIVEELNIDIEPITKKIKSERAAISREALNDPEKSLYDIVSDEPVHIDDIVKMSSLPASEVVKNLLRLEIKRLVRELPGKNYVCAAK